MSRATEVKKYRKYILSLPLIDTISFNNGISYELRRDTETKEYFWKLWNSIMYDYDTFKG